MQLAKYSTLACGLLLAAIVGCGGAAPPAKKTVEATDGKKVADGHDHSGWWCKEHGVPEEVCSLCSPKVAAKFKKDGDWCEKHERADSQCFHCHPERFEKFAAQYEAKYGEKPAKWSE